MLSLSVTSSLRMCNLLGGYLALRSSKAEGFLRVAVAMSPLSRTVLVIERPIPEDEPVTKCSLRQFLEGVRCKVCCLLNQTRGRLIV